MKKCSRCYETKPFACFAPRPSHSSGYRSACRDCESTTFGVWYANNLDQQRERMRAAATKRQESGQAAAYEAANKAHLSEVREKWHQSNIERTRETANARTTALPDSVVRGMIVRVSGINGKEITNALIELKREQLILHRLGRQIKQAAKQIKEKT